MQGLIVFTFKKKEKYNKLIHPQALTRVIYSLCFKNHFLRHPDGLVLTLTQWSA